MKPLHEFTKEELIAGVVNGETKLDKLRESLKTNVQEIFDRYEPGLIILDKVRHEEITFDIAGTFDSAYEKSSLYMQRELDGRVTEVGISIMQTPSDISFSKTYESSERHNKNLLKVLEMSINNDNLRKELKEVTELGFREINAVQIAVNGINKEIRRRELEKLAEEIEEYLNARFDIFLKNFKNNADKAVYLIPDERDIPERPYHIIYKKQRYVLITDESDKMFFDDTKEKSVMFKLLQGLNCNNVLCTNYMPFKVMLKDLLKSNKNFENRTTKNELF